jgi:hypothetical protein
MDREELVELLQEEEAPAAVGRMRSWAFVALLSALIALGAIWGAAAVLSEAALGRSAARPGCEPALGAGLLLLALAGAMLGLVRVAVDRRYPVETRYDMVRLAAALPVPVACLALTAPGFLGCELALKLDRIDWLGRLVLGTPGLAIAAASALALGAAFVSAVRVQIPVALVIQQYELERSAGVAQPDLVDRVLERQADADPPDDPAGFGRYPPAIGAHPPADPTRRPEPGDDA